MANERRATRAHLGAFAAALIAATAAGCAATGESSSLGPGTKAGAPSGDSPGGDGTSFAPGDGPGSSTGAPCDSTAADVDADGDGFTVAAGDCNDCSPQVNPGAYDAPGDNADGDCNGTVDDEPVGCDIAIGTIDSNDPMDAARAIGLCRSATGQSWGVLDAAYVGADGSGFIDPRSHGLLRAFGSNVAPREATRMLVLSSGTARSPSDPGYQSPDGALLGTQSATPPGFPVDSPSCSQAVYPGTTAYDPAALELTMRAPTNASSFEVDFNFYTFEFPVYVCDEFNDFFVLLQSPAPQASQFGNVAFDNLGNPVSVNNGYLEVCSPRSAGGKTFDCPQGPAQLLGTGFGSDASGEAHAATGWLRTQSPVQPGGEITLRFAVWDTGDSALASTVLVDNFRWQAQDAPNGPVTAPVPK